MSQVIQTLSAIRLI